MSFFTNIVSFFKDMDDDMRRIYILTIVPIVIVIIIGIVSLVLKLKDTSKWQCVKGVTAAVRRNKQGDVECYSIDGNDCKWLTCVSDSIDPLPDDKLKPIVCKRSDFYPGHWCYKAKAHL